MNRQRALPLFAFAFLCTLAAPVWADGITIQGGKQAPSGEYIIEGSAVQTVCVTPAAAGVTISATANEPGCITVAPATAVTGVDGCASFTVSCATNSCIGTVTYSAPGYPSTVGRYRCDSGGTPNDVPMTGTWGLLGMVLLLLGGSMWILRSRARTEGL